MHSWKPWYPLSSREHHNAVLYHAGDLFRSNQVAGSGWYLVSTRFGTFFLSILMLAWRGCSEARSHFGKYVTDKYLEITLPSWRACSVNREESLSGEERQNCNPRSVDRENQPHGVHKVTLDPPGWAATNLPRASAAAGSFPKWSAQLHLLCSW